MIRILRKFSSILNRKQKIRVVIIAIMMVIGALLETLGVGLILPLVNAITEPDFISANKYASMVCDWLDIKSTSNFLILVIIALIFIYIFKNIYLFFEYYVQHRFVCNNRYAVQSQLMRAYIHRPYEYYLNAESGEITRVITDDVRSTFDLLSTLMTFFTEAVISVALIATIIAADPFMACLIAIVLGGMMCLIQKMIKPVLRKAGIRYQKNAAKMNKWLFQSINGIKEIKVARRETYFLAQFEKYGKITADSEKRNSVIGTIPRLSIEAFSISSMLAVIAILMMTGREVNSMLPQLSAFAMAAVRLMPSVNRMSSALNAISYREPALDKMLEHLAVTNEWDKELSSGKLLIESNVDNSTNTLSFSKSMELSDIVYSYPNTDVNVISHANMVIPIGKSVGIVGSSGSGKTTAIDILLGLLSPQEGQVLVDGVDIQENYHSWLSHLAYIPQMIFMLDDTIRANVAFGISEKEADDAQVWKALEEAQLKEFVQTLPDGLDTTIGERGVRLSGGQRQRIGIARALYTDPELLIFDEATSALDNETEAAIMDSINALHGKKTMIIIAHRLSTIEECDIVYRVENGKIEKER